MALRFIPRARTRRCFGVGRFLAQSGGSYPSPYISTRRARTCLGQCFTRRCPASWPWCCGDFFAQAQSRRRLSGGANRCDARCRDRQSVTRMACRRRMRIHSSVSHGGMGEGRAFAEQAPCRASTNIPRLSGRVTPRPTRRGNSLGKRHNELKIAQLYSNIACVPVIVR